MPEKQFLINKAPLGRDLLAEQLTEMLSNYGPIEYLWVDHVAGTDDLRHAFKRS
jgi:hypothetical protein